MHWLLAPLILSSAGSHINGAEERKRHDLALEKLQKARDEWNRDRMKHLDLINKMKERNILHERNKPRAYIKNVD